MLDSPQTSNLIITVLLPAGLSDELPKVNPKRKLPTLPPLGDGRWPSSNQPGTPKNDIIYDDTRNPFVDLDRIAPAIHPPAMNQTSPQLVSNTLPRPADRDHSLSPQSTTNTWCSPKALNKHVGRKLPLPPVPSKRVFSSSRVDDGLGNEEGKRYEEVGLKTPSDGIRGGSDSDSSDYDDAISTIVPPKAVLHQRKNATDQAYNSSLHNSQASDRSDHSAIRNGRSGLPLPSIPMEKPSPKTRPQKRTPKQWPPQMPLVLPQEQVQPMLDSASRADFKRRLEAMSLQHGGAK